MSEYVVTDEYGNEATAENPIELRDEYDVEPIFKSELARMTVRVSDEELHSWKVAAALRGVSLSEWVRSVLNEEGRDAPRAAVERPEPFEAVREALRRRAESER